MSLCNHVDIALLRDAKCRSCTLKHYAESFLPTAFSQVNVRPRLRSSIGLPVRTCIGSVSVKDPLKGPGWSG